MHFNMQVSLVWAISSIIILIAIIPCIINLIFYLLTIFKNSPNIKIEKHLFRPTEH